MATQTLAHVAKQSKLAVVISIPKPSIAPISQRVLTEFVYLKRLAREAQEEFAAKGAEISAMLEASAPIEPGVHTARFEDRFHESVSWKKVAIRLAERLKLNGEAYCKNVLTHTKPTRTVELVVD